MPSTRFRRTRPQPLPGPGERLPRPGNGACVLVCPRCLRVQCICPPQRTCLRSASAAAGPPPRTPRKAPPMSIRLLPTGPLNKTLLGETVAAQLGIPRKEGTAVVDAVFDIITRSVAAGHPVRITNFGTFSARHATAHPARNPQTGQTLVIPARQKVRFCASPRLRELVRAADPAAATIRKHPKTPAKCA